jgi:hypothetical protein
MAGVVSMNEQNVQENGERVKRLYFRLQEHKYDLVSVPSLVRQIVKDDLWRKFTVDTTGKVVEQESFLEFVTQPHPEGLGATYKNLWILCQDDIEVQEMLVSLIPNEPAPFSIKKEVKPEAPKPKIPQTKDFKRLKREAEKGHKKAIKLLQQVENGAKNEKGKPMTPYRALVELGIHKKVTSIPKEVKDVANKLQRTFDQKQIAELVSRLTDAIPKKG